jgi:hypothetical protein
MPSVASNSGTGSGETPNPLVLMSWMISPSGYRPETWWRQSAGRKRKRELFEITRNAKSVRIIAHVLIVSETRR